MTHHLSSQHRPELCGADGSDHPEQVEQPGLGEEHELGELPEQQRDGRQTADTQHLPGGGREAERLDAIKMVRRVKKLETT